MTAPPFGLPVLNGVGPGTETGTIPSTAAKGGPTPPAANPGIANPLAAAQGNPFAPASAIPIGSVPGAAAPTAGQTTGAGTVQSNGINWADGSNTITGDLKDTYGAGTGKAVSAVLQNMGTVNDAAIQATIANTDLAAGKEYANIQSGEAASGVTANSSTAALAGGDFYSGVNSQLQQTIGSEEVNEENTLLGTLTKEGEQHGPDESTWDSVMSGITDAGEIVGSVAGAATGLSSVTSAIDPNADTSILDSLGGL
jgi:hypothetical protein